MGTATNREIVEQYLEAFGKSEFDSVRELLHDDFSFRGPMESHESADSFVGSIRSHMQGFVKRITLSHIFEDGDNVAVFYDMVTNTPAGTLGMAELYRIRQSKIASITLIFDPRPLLQGSST